MSLSTVSSTPDITLTFGKATMNINGYTLSETLSQSNTIDIVYPVGSIYISSNTTNPSNTFGGTWEEVSVGLSDLYFWKRTA